MLIKVKVVPEADEAKVIKRAEDEFKVKVKEKPERGEANKAVNRVLTNYFDLNEGDIRLVKGGKRRNKIFKVPNDA